MRSLRLETHAGAAMAFLLVDDAGNHITDFTVRTEVTATARYTVITWREPGCSTAD